MSRTTQVAGVRFVSDGSVSLKAVLGHYQGSPSPCGPSAQADPQYELTTPAENNRVPPGASAGTHLVDLCQALARFQLIRKLRSVVQVHQAYPVKEQSHRPYAVRVPDSTARCGGWRFWAAALRSRGHPREEDLHTIYMRSASLLHTGGLRCWVTKGQGPLKGMVAWFNCGMPRAFLLTRIRANVPRHFERRPQSEPRLAPAGFGRSQPADLAQVRPTASR